MSELRVLGVIPARGKSKRVPRKNLRMLRGKPLIAWTIEAAHAATKLTSLAVSTDCMEIAQVANLYGAYVIKRPEELATDTATSGSVCRHALDWMENSNSNYDVVVLLHPTSPIRDPAHIDQAIYQLWRSPYPTLASVCPLPHKSHANIGIIDDWHGAFAATSLHHYIMNASIYAMKRDWFIQHNRHVPVNEPILPFVMDRKHSLDIDEELDLQLAELFLNGNI